MRTFTVAEAQKQLSQIIADVNRGEYIVLSDGDQKVTLCPGGVIDPEEDSPELEAELLKAAKGPFTPYSRDEMKAIVQKVIDEHSKK